MRILGLDVGDKRVGVALSDPLGIIATPYVIIERESETRDIAAILNIVDTNEVGVIVAGLPLDLEGRIGPQAAKTKGFIDALARQTRIPVETRDESLTTKEARNIMLTSRSRKNRRQNHDDDVAAAVLLQAYLEEKRSSDSQIHLQ